jgi:hypothetical protein
MNLLEFCILSVYLCYNYARENVYHTARNAKECKIGKLNYITVNFAKYDIVKLNFTNFMKLVPAAQMSFPNSKVLMSFQNSIGETLRAICMAEIINS